VSAGFHSLGFDDYKLDGVLSATYLELLRCKFNLPTLSESLVKHIVYQCGGHPAALLTTVACFHEFHRSKSTSDFSNQLFSRDFTRSFVRIWADYCLGDEGFLSFEDRSLIAAFFQSIVPVELDATVHSKLVKMNFSGSGELYAYVV
jgi:hypothetical protein